MISWCRFHLLNYHLITMCLWWMDVAFPPAAEDYVGSQHIATNHIYENKMQRVHYIDNNKNCEGHAINTLKNDMIRINELRTCLKITFLFYSAQCSETLGIQSYFFDSLWPVDGVTPLSNISWVP